MNEFQIQQAHHAAHDALKTAKDALEQAIRELDRYRERLDEAPTRREASC